MNKLNDGKNENVQFEVGREIEPRHHTDRMWEKIPREETMSPHAP